MSDTTTTLVGLFPKITNTTGFDRALREHRRTLEKQYGATVSVTYPDRTSCKVVIVIPTKQLDKYRAADEGKLRGGQLEAIKLHCGTPQFTTTVT